MAEVLHKPGKPKGDWFAKFKLCWRFRFFKIWRFSNEKPRSWLRRRIVRDS